MADISILLEKIRKANAIFIVGNGGSHANSLHMVNDLIACGVRAFAIDPATLTAMANDYGYRECFARWIETVATKHDLLIALSGSGTSENILTAMVAAKKIGMDWYIVTDYLRTRDMQQSEEDQLVLGHELMRALKNGPTA